MDRAAADQAIKSCLTEIHSRLGEAARIAKAAEACALAGSITHLRLNGHQATDL
jgi:hypothetical protein